MKIGIVNDQALAREALRRVVVSDPAHRVAWLARDGSEAVDLACSERPDLILMDLIMPGVDGVEATRRIMQCAPCPILVVTASMAAQVGRVYEAMGLGALDAVDTPGLGPTGDLAGASPLLEKIRTIGKLVGRAANSEVRVPSTGSDESAGPACPLVALGSSTGGPAAVAEILSGLPDSTRPAVVIVQHVDEAFAPGLASWLSGRSGRKVELAEAGDAPTPGRVLLAATNDHAILDESRRIRYVPEPASIFYRPSVDVFFASLAARWPRPGVAAVLTGMGRDGASGLLALRRAGWSTIAQDEASSVVYGMPRAAAEAGAAEVVLPLPEIAPAIARRIADGPHHRRSRPGAESR